MKTESLARGPNGIRPAPSGRFPIRPRPRVDTQRACRLEHAVAMLDEGVGLHMLHDRELEFEALLGSTAAEIFLAQHFHCELPAKDAVNHFHHHPVPALPQPIHDNVRWRWSRLLGDGGYGTSVSRVGGRRRLPPSGGHLRQIPNQFGWECGDVDFIFF